MTERPKRTQINMGITPDLMAAIDEARGDVPRTAWVRRAIVQRLQRDRAKAEEIPKREDQDDGP